MKDAALNVELQDEVGMPLDVMRTIARVVKRAVASGLGGEDLYAIEKWFAARRILLGGLAPGSTRLTSEAPPLKTIALTRLASSTSASEG